MFYWAYQLSSKPTFTSIFKTVIPDCDFLRNLKFYLHNPYHSSTLKIKTFWFIFMDGSTARLETHYEVAVYYLQLSSRKFLVLTVSGVSGLNNLTTPGNIFSKLDKIRKKCLPNGNHYIFSADLTRLKKMFSLFFSFYTY